MANDSSSGDLADSINKNLCQGCSACCRYFSVKINAPDNPKDLDTAAWYLYHKAKIFLDDEGWFVQIDADCMNLNQKGECMIYATRPNICREYAFEDCEKCNPKGFCLTFETVKELQNYLKDSKHEK